MRIDVSSVKNFKTLHISQRLLLMIFAITGDDGAFRFRPGDMAKRIETSERTVRGYIKNLVDCDLIKYKYSGSGRINPSFYYTGETAQQEQVKKEYADFRSDY